MQRNLTAETPLLMRPALPSAPDMRMSPLLFPRNASHTSLVTACSPSSTRSWRRRRATAPRLRALFYYEYPTQPELFGVDQQWLIGESVLVMPVMEVNMSTVQDYFTNNDGRRSWFVLSFA